MSIEDWQKLPRTDAERLLGWDTNTETFRLGGMVVVASDDDQYDETGENWRHVSFSRKDALPTWEDMCRVRADFFPPEALVVQVFPPVKEYRNLHPHCLHFWWNKDRRLVPKETADAVAL